MTSFDHRDTLAEFIDWCRQERKVALEAIPLFETGKMRIGSMVAGQLVDQSAEHVTHLRRTVEETDKIITDYESKKSDRR
jgi:hypothetical protein